MSDYYVYNNKQGYGHTDHLAPEVIARAARLLGLAGADEAVLQHAGFASHAVGVSSSVRLPYAKGVGKRMQKALDAAREEMPCRVSTCIEVQRRRETEDIEPISDCSRYVTSVVEVYDNDRKTWKELTRGKRRYQTRKREDNGEFGRRRHEWWDVWRDA